MEETFLGRHVTSAKATEAGEVAEVRGHAGHACAQGTGVDYD